MVLRRLSGRTENTAPVMTLITQFGAGRPTRSRLCTILPTLAARLDTCPVLPGFYERSVSMMCPPPEWASSWATPGIPLPVVATLGSIWHTRWRVKPASPPSVRPPRRRLPGPRR